MNRPPVEAVGAGSPTRPGPSRLSRMARSGASLAMALILLLLEALPVAAFQGAPAPSLRPYAHVFVAYAIGWGLVFAWIVLTARRVARLEARLREWSASRGD